MSEAGVHIERLAIVGLGLLGGSVALAARRAGVVSHVVATGRRQAPLEAALASGVVDEIGDLATAVRGADWIVLGTPVSAMPRIVEEAAPHMREGAIVTDVGSVKGMQAEMLPGLLPPGAHYVGSHPMAGSHLRGVEHARAELFDGAACVVTPLPGVDPAIVARVRAFWLALGARVVDRDPVTHDLEVAWVSHLPHVVAFAFGQCLAEAPETAGELAGSGFRDFTRIAWSDAELWGDILSANRKALAGPIHTLGEALKSLAVAIEQADTEAQERFFSSAREKLVAVAAASGSPPASDEVKTPDPGA